MKRLHTKDEVCAKLTADLLLAGLIRAICRLRRAARSLRRLFIVPNCWFFELIVSPPS